jgi:4-hydroxybenzoate polyprenyltransferase
LGGRQVVKVMVIRTGPIIVVVLAAAAAVALVLGVSVSRLLPWLLVLACPLMMLFMHHGGHGGHRSHGAEHTEPRDDLHITKQ